MKKIILFSLMALMLIMVSACKNDPSKTEADGVISVILDNKDRVYLEGIIEGFEEKYKEEGYKVVPIWTAGDDIQSSQATKIGAGNPADLIIGGDMYTEVYRRSLLDLSELIERDKEELDMADFFDGILDRLENSSGNLVFLPRYFNLSLLYFNKDLFNQSKEQLLASDITPAPAGTPESEAHYPHVDWTIEDYFTAGGILTKLNGTEYVQWGSTLVGGWWGEWLIHVRQSGGDLFDDNGYVTFDNENVKKAMQIYRDKAYGNQELNRPKISAAAGQTDFAGFQGLRVAMEYGGHTANWSRYDSMANLNWGVTLLPTGLEKRGGAEFAIDGIGIYKNTPDIEASWAFIKYLVSKEGIKRSSDAGYLTIRKSVLEEMPEGDVKNRTSLVVSVLDPNSPYYGYAMTLPKYEYFSDISMSLMNPIISLMMANDSSRLSIETAIQRIEKQSNDYINLNYK